MWRRISGRQTRRVDDDVLGHFFVESQLLNQIPLPKFQGGVDHVQLLIHDHFSQDLLLRWQRLLQLPTLFHKNGDVAEIRAAFVANSLHFFHACAICGPALKKKPLLHLLVQQQALDGILLGLLHLRDLLWQHPHRILCQLHHARTRPAHAAQRFLVDEVLQMLRGN